MLNNLPRSTVLEGASQGAQMVRYLPSMWETWVQSLDWDNPLEKIMATHSSILAWRIPMDRGAWWATVHGVAKSQTQLSDQNTHTHTHTPHSKVREPGSLPRFLTLSHFLKHHTCCPLQVPPDSRRLQYEGCPKLS